MARLVFAVSAILLAAAQKNGTGDAFCSNGVVVPPSDLLDDDGVPSVDVILAQAPLFSTGGNRMFGLLGLYHTALVFSQPRADGTPHYWTLEFDAVAGPVAAVVPELTPRDDGGVDMRWHADARFCLTEGREPLWGRRHWTKSFAPAAKLTAAEVRRTFAEAVLPFNGTGVGTAPQYQLWSVKPAIADHEVQDVTCADGVSWVLHYLSTTLNVVPLDGARHFRSTEVLIPGAFSITPVNMSDASAREDVVDFYRKQIELAEGNGASAFRRLLDLFQVLPMKYIHDSATGVYFQVSARDRFQRPLRSLRFSFEPKRLSGPGFSATSANSSAKLSPADLFV